MRVALPVLFCAACLWVAGCEPASLAHVGAPDAVVGDAILPTLPPVARGNVRHAIALRLDGREAPRMIELWLKPGAGLHYVGANAGGAARAAAKDVLVQERNGLLRVVAFTADNVDRINDGVVAFIEFSVDGADTSLTALPERSHTAPRDLRLIDAIAITEVGQ